MEVKAVGRYMKVQPRKVRIVADEVRGKYAVHAVHLLRFHPSKSAQFLRKVLVSAISNAQENNGLAPEGLKIVRIQVDEGPRQKRIQARAQGRANRIIKKTSHITVIVDEGEAPKAFKAHGTKAKPRPKFEAPKKSKKPVAEVKEEAPVVDTVEETPVEAAAEEASAPEAAAEETAVEATEESPEGDTPSEEGK